MKSKFNFKKKTREKPSIKEYNNYHTKYFYFNNPFKNYY